MYLWAFVFSNNPHLDKSLYFIKVFSGFCAFSPTKPPKIAIWTNWTNDLDQFGPIPFQSFIVSLHLQKVMKRRGGDSCVPEQQEIMKKYSSHRLDFQNYLLSLQRRPYNWRQTSRRANKLYPVSKSGKLTAAWGKVWKPGSVCLYFLPSRGDYILVEASSHISTGVSWFSFFMLQVFQNLLTRNVKKAHTSVYVNEKNSNKKV